MKKVFSCLVAAALLLSVLPASLAESAEEPLRVVATIFPQYDWVREIIGDLADHYELTLLLDTGVDLHSYQPTVDDMVKISECDLFLYVGGESDKWVKDVLATAASDQMIALSLLDSLGEAVKEEEVVEGMEAEHDHDQENGEHEESETDEHVWLSLRNASTLCRAIADQLSILDPANADIYAANAAAYVDRLNDLDAKYQAAVEAGTKKTLLFGDRFPFRYLADDYGLDYYAAFTGCSADSEASFETIMFLAGKVDELGLNAVMTLEGSDHQIAQTVVASTKNRSAQVLTMDSMQSVTRKDVADGASYYAIMEKNLEALQGALQ